VQNYRESAHPHREAQRRASGSVSSSSMDVRQVLGVVLAAVLVAIVLSVFALIGARLTPGGGDCVLTDNAGCVEAGSAGLAGKVDVGAGTARRG
jgi:hypothetical protein